MHVIERSIQQAPGALFYGQGTAKSRFILHPLLTRYNNTDHALILRTVPPLCYVLRISGSSKKLGFLKDGAC